MNSEHFKLGRIVVLCVALICIVCACGGIFLSFKGYTEAQMLIQVASAGVGGLLGVISLRNPAQGSTANIAGDATITTPAPPPAQPI